MRCIEHNQLALSGVPRLYERHFIGLTESLGMPTVQSNSRIGCGLVPLRRQWTLWAIVATVTVLCEGTFGFSEDRALSAHELDLLNGVKKSISTNHSKYQSLKFTMTRLLSDLTLKQERVVETPGIKGRSSPIAMHEFEVTIAGDSVRRDTTTGHDQGRIETPLKGFQIDFYPKGKMAKIMTAAKTRGRIEPLDPRCLGFEPPLLSLADWFQNAKLRHVRSTKTGVSESIEIEASDAAGTMTVTFASNRNWLPIRIAREFDEGAARVVTEIQHEKLKSMGAWFPKSATTLNWNGNPAKLINRREYTITNLQENPVLPKDHFDCTFPVGTTVIDWVAKQNWEPLKRARKSSEYLISLQMK